MAEFRYIDSTKIGSAERVYPVYKLIPLTAHLAKAGISADNVLLGSDIAAIDLEDPYVKISRQQVAVVFDNFLRLAPSDTNPFELGAAFHLTDFGFYGYALLSSATVRDAMHFGIKYRELATPIVDVEITESDEDVVWFLRALPEVAANDLMNRFVLEYQSGIILSLHKNVSGDAFKMHSASFAFAEPVRIDYFGNVLDCPVTFGAKRTELRFKKSWLDMRPLGANAATFQLVHDACNEMLDRIGGGRGVVGDIYRQLLAMTGQFPTLDNMAVTLDIHPRTLRRKITNEGSTYQKIVDEVRFKLASIYLNRTEMTHESISERLGFSDASSFRRAFKRWAQQSPNDFRNRP